MVWTWAVGPGASAPNPGPSRELTRAYGRVVTWRVAGHDHASFTIDGRSDEAAEIRERETDLWVWRDGSLVFRGRVAGAQHDVDANRHVVQFQAVDYRGMLTLAAAVEAAVSFSSVDQGVIPWQMIQTWQTLPGGNWGISNGVGQTSGTLRDDSDIMVGTPVGEVVDRIARREGGFEWEISPTLELNRWHPAQGSDHGVVVDYGGMLTAVRMGTPEFGNSAVATGDQDTTPVTRQTANVGTDPRGRWTVTQGFPTVSRQSTVAAKAAWLRDQASTVELAWTATMAPRRWDGLDHIGKGDVVLLRVASGPLDVASPHRVVEIQAVPGEHGTETINLGLVGVAA